MSLSSSSLETIRKLRLQLCLRKRKMVTMREQLVQEAAESKEVRTLGWVGVEVTQASGGLKIMESHTKCRADTGDDPLVWPVTEDRAAEGQGQLTYTCGPTPGPVAAGRRRAGWRHRTHCHVHPCTPCRTLSRSRLPPGSCGHSSTQHRTPAQHTGNPCGRLLSGRAEATMEPWGQGVSRRDHRWECGHRTWRPQG
jgi:hypothetical protein